VRLKGMRVGFALTGSHCTMDEIITEIDNIKKNGAEVISIISYSVDQTNSRYGKADKWKGDLLKITGEQIISTITGAEPIGPEKMFDVLVIAPCTGNTVAKLANAITDTPVLMAAKAHLRNHLPVVLAISTNDGLGLNARNVGVLINTKNIYMVPFGQDNPTGKPNSLKADMSMIIDTIISALQGKQIQPVLLSYQ